MSRKKRKKKVVHFTSIDELVSLRQSRDVNDLIDESLTFGERLSDALAAFAGSWGFIIFFSIIIFGWVTANILSVVYAWDPYPFILLNLLLSMIAALQAPIIMMSQNRQEDKDRIRSEHDYHVNLKAEILIEEVLLRLDQLEEQNARLLAKLDKKDAQLDEINNNLNQIVE